MNLRHNFEGDAVTPRASRGSGAVEAPFVVENQVGVGLGAVGADEGVQNGVGPLAILSGRQFVDYSTITT